MNKLICPLIKKCKIKVDEDWFLTHCMNNYGDCPIAKKLVRVPSKTPKEWLVKRKRKLKEYVVTVKIYTTGKDEEEAEDNAWKFLVECDRDDIDFYVEENKNKESEEFGD